MYNNINDFILKWEELKKEKDYEYNFLSVEDAEYIDKYYNFNLDELFNDEKYGNEAFLKSLKNKNNTVLTYQNKEKGNNTLNIVYAVRCFIAFKNPNYTKDFWDIDIKKLDSYPMALILIYNKTYLEKFEKKGQFYGCLATYGYKPEMIIEKAYYYSAISDAMKFIDKNELINYLDSDKEYVYCSAIELCDKNQLEEYGIEKLKNKKGALLRLIRKGFFLEDGINSNDSFEVSSAINNDCNFNEQELINKFKDDIGSREFNPVLNSIDCYNLRNGKIKKKYNHNTINTLLNNLDFNKYWDYVVYFGDYSNKIRLIKIISKSNLRLDLLDKLVNDEAFQVRIAVAKLGYQKYLDILKNDDNEYVKLVIKEQLNKIS